MSKMLVLSPRCPLPEVDGARVASVQLLKVLQTHFGGGGSFIGCVPNRPGDVTPQELKQAFQLDHVWLFPRVSLGGSLMQKLLRPWVPFTVLGLDSPEYSAEIEAALEGRRVILVDGMHAGYPLLKSRSLLAKIRKNKIRVIYRAHNVEADIWQTKTRQVPFYLKPFFQFEAWAMKHCERRLVRISDETWTVSEDDGRIFCQWVPDAVTVNVRISQPFPKECRIVRKRSQKLRLGFLGSMDWGPNKEGLVWFLKEIWPQLQKDRPDFEVVVAGSRASPELAQQLKATPGLRFLGQVGKVSEFYEQVDWFLVPIFYGSGTRVKVIESSKEAVPCFSTALGVSGVGLTAGQSFIQAETREEWAEKIRALSFDQSIECGKKAFSAAQTNFGEDAVTAVVKSRLGILHGG